ncbi:hypothetical protein RD792_002372 [Penstemon davidsonii]|uniref:Uncharacterized protein n=1 Tax=Penstemon davidsonii TaxID=160366 RepID=A0ABR0DR64_9LAMI|nr:hypothetical protein RD792_002372 [Penstemon davidsonii]
MLTVLFLTLQEFVVVLCEPKVVPCYFIFGDSLVDNGNNLFRETTAKVNYMPYGIDFPDGPTGRFTNGRTIADITAELLGFEERIPPYVNATNGDFLRGVNYGSGGCGILHETGRQLYKLYDYGARKVAVSELGKLGCVPQEVSAYGASEGSLCVETSNNLVQIFNAKLKLVIEELNYNLGDANFVYVSNVITSYAQLLGFDKPIQPFATASGSDILNGVNYASGASGIRDESGMHLGDRISLSGQLINHATTISHLGRLISPPNTVNNYLNKCLYTINIGSNDYINNYLLPRFYRTSVQFTPDQYAEALIQQYTLQLRTLYNNGARKIVIIGLGFIGCIPQELANFPTNGSSCVNSINNNVQLFNNRLKPLIDNLNTNLPGAQFIYINTTSISSGDPSAIGIKTVNAPCCVVSSSNGQCGPNQVPCSDRQKFVFWDNFHPTELLNQVTATRAYNATLPSDAYPTDIRHLVQQ